ESWTSTSWNAERNFSINRADRMKKPQSSVRYSVIAPGARSPSGGRAVILAPAANRLIACALRFQDFLQRAKHALRLAAVVGGVIADVDVDGDESGFRPRMNREMRFGEQHRAGDALGLELKEPLADDRKPGLLNGLETSVAQCIGARENRRVGRAAVPFA